MALIKCRECQTEVSSEAKQCPKCAAPVNKKQFGCLSAVVAIFIGIFVLAVISSTVDKMHPPPAPLADKSLGEFAAKRQAEIKKAISERKIFIGMSDDDVRKSWGKPEKINSTISVGGKHEQWVYSDQYLYFENGTLTSMQTTR
jgi:hypothetical protein